MEVRKARQEDLPAIEALALQFDLDHANMQAENFIVAEEKGLIIGIGQILPYPDCMELASLGVLPEFQRTGIGKKIVEALLADTQGEVYLATIRPDYFSRFGFKKTLDFPVSMKKKSEWCEGCRPELCTVMVLKR